MQRVKRKIYSGCILEQEVYSVERVRNIKSAEPYLRFKSPEERKTFNNANARRNFIRLVNENFTPAGYYCTLTLSPENECHDFFEAKVLRDRFVRRLRRKAPDVRIVIVMGRGKNTKRIHFHMIAEGVEEGSILAAWKYGEVVEITHLKEHNYYDDGTGGMVDHGRDYTSVASYMFDHWSEEQSKACGHRWKATRNLKKPEKEAARPIKRNYTPEHPPKTPKGYKLVDITYTKYGYINFKYVIDTGRNRDLASDFRRYRPPDIEWPYRKAKLP